MESNFTPILKQILQAGLQEAMRHNSSIVMPEHLLLALLKEPSSTPFRLVESARRPTNCARASTKLCGTRALRRVSK